VDGGDIYLEPTAALQVAQQVARDIGDSLSITGNTLHKRLAEQSLLASTEPVRGTLTVRRTLSGGRKTVLHLHAATLLAQEADQTDHSDGTEREAPPSDSEQDHAGQLSWSGLRRSDARTDQQTRPDRNNVRIADSPGGQRGRIGQVSREDTAFTDQEEGAADDWEEVP
jgi:hypothetical protein